MNALSPTGKDLETRLTLVLEREMNALGKRHGVQPMAWRLSATEGRPWLIGSVNAGHYPRDECARVVEGWASAFGMVHRETDFGTLEFDGEIDGFGVTVWTVTDPAAFYPAMAGASAK